MPVFQASQLKSLYRSFILELGGLPEEADTFADVFVLADLRGMEWQGLRSLHKHIVFPIQQGIMRLRQEIEVLHEAPSALAVDGKDELGQVVCSRVMKTIIDKAEVSGSCVGTIRSAGDSGLLGGYTTMALPQDCIGIMFNTTNPYVAPWGGAERTLGITPISIAVPAGQAYPIVVDMAVTRAQHLFNTDEAWKPPFPKPPLMLFETVREYVLGAVLEAICGGLTLNPIGRDKTRRGECAVVAMAIHVPHFVGMPEFLQAVDRYVDQIKSTPRDAAGTEIVLPGEREMKEQERRLREGIPVNAEDWAGVAALAADLGIDWEEAVGLRP